MIKHVARAKGEDKASSYVSAKGRRDNEITRISGRVSSSSEISRRWISRCVTHGGTAILSRPLPRLLPGSGASSRCTMISGGWALNRGTNALPLNAKWGGNSFSQQPTTGNLYHRSCSIPSPSPPFDHLLVPQPLLLITVLPSSLDCANQLRAFGIGKKNSDF